MIKIKNICRSLVVPVLVASGIIAPIVATQSAAFADDSTYCPSGGTCVYWDGTGQSGFSTTNSTGSATSLSNADNWSTVAPNPGGSAATPSAATLADGDDYLFDLGASGTLTATNSLTYPPSYIGVIAGSVTFSGAESSSSPQALASGTTIWVNNAADSGPSSGPAVLNIEYVTDSGALTLDGVDFGDAGNGDNSANFKAPSSSYVTGPLTIQDTSNTTAIPVSPADLLGLLGDANSAGSTVTLGDNAVLTLTAAASFGTYGSNWTINVGGTTGDLGVLDLEGTSGTTYVGDFVGDGGMFEVDSGDAGNITQTLDDLTLDADSIANVVASTDTLAATNFTPNSFSFSAATDADGTFPTSASGSGSSGGSGGSSGSSSSGSSSETTPKTPDTGFALTAAKASPVIITTTFAAVALFFIAKRLKPASKK